ncbi:MAG TPA: amino acid ABC transporter substrate-binding protein [Burkholderiaceae bacterium]|nr:amino acid ABC transporter substrate-binding protein [Burkholderiaceae bacterium]
MGLSNFLREMARVQCLCFLALVGTPIGTYAANSPSSPTLDHIRKTGTIVLAHREASVPFSYVVDGRPIGYALDLCKQIAQAVQRRLGMPKIDIQYQLVTPANRFEMLRSGKADLECGSTTNTAERRKLVAFTVPHFVTTARLLVRSSLTVRRLEDLRGRPIVSTKGTTTLKLLAQENEARVLRLHILEAADHAEGFRMVATGEADAFVMDDVLLYGLRAGASDPSKFEIVGEPMSIEPYAIALRRDDPEFKKIVDAEMARLILAGEGTALYRKWFLQPIPPRGAVLNIPIGRLLRDAWRYPSDQVAN